MDWISVRVSFEAKEMVTGLLSLAPLCHLEKTAPTKDRVIEGHRMALALHLIEQFTRDRRCVDRHRTKPRSNTWP
jgi:hypothetical protein